MTSDGSLVPPHDPLDDLVGELGALGLAAQIPRQVLALLDGGEARILDDVSVRDQLHVAQHHHGRQQKCRGVGQVLAGDVGRRSVHLTQTKTRRLVVNLQYCLYSYSKAQYLQTRRELR